MPCPAVSGTGGQLSLLLSLFPLHAQKFPQELLPQQIRAGQGASQGSIADLSAESTWAVCAGGPRVRMESAILCF